MKKAGRKREKNVWYTRSAKVPFAFPAVKGIKKIPIKKIRYKIIGKILGTTPFSAGGFFPAATRLEKKKNPVFSLHGGCTPHVRRFLRLSRQHRQVCTGASPPALLPHPSDLTKKSCMFSPSYRRRHAARLCRSAQAVKNRVFRGMVYHWRRRRRRTPRKTFPLTKKRGKMPHSYAIKRQKGNRKDRLSSRAMRNCAASHAWEACKSRIPLIKEDMAMVKYPAPHGRREGGAFSAVFCPEELPLPEYGVYKAKTAGRYGTAGMKNPGPPAKAAGKPGKHGKKSRGLRTFCHPARKPADSNPSGCGTDSPAHRGG